MHLYVALVPNRNSPPAYLLREGYREGGKVKTRTLANLSHWSLAKIERLRRVLRDETLPDAGEGHPDILVKILAVKARANDWRKANLQKAAAITARHDGAPSDKPYLQQTTAEIWLTSRQILAAYKSGAFRAGSRRVRRLCSIRR